jgi:hypothetical protein
MRGPGTPEINKNGICGMILDSGVIMLEFWVGVFMEGVNGWVVVGVSLDRPSSPYFLLVPLVFTVTVFCGINDGGV